MFHEIYEFANKGIYTFEEILEKDLSLSGDTNIEEPNKKHLKLELSGDYIGTFCYLLKNQSINQEIVATIYDEEYICNEYTNKQRKQLIKKLNTLPIKQIRFILSNETLPIYNELMLKENWQHKNKTTVTMTLDYEPKNQEIRPFMFDQLTKSMEEICEFSPRTVCVENMVGDRLLNKMSEAKELLSRVPKLYMTIDVNHSLLQKPEDYIACIGDRVKNLHISDNDGTDERHWLPGEGIINFNAILSNLEKIGYNGTFNYEVNIKADDGVKKVKENFDKLFNDYNNK
jgi:hypothetical protein